MKFCSLLCEFWKFAYSLSILGNNILPKIIAFLSYWFPHFIKKIMLFFKKFSTYSIILLYFKGAKISNFSNRWEIGSKIFATKFQKFLLDRALVPNPYHRISLWKLKFNSFVTFWYSVSKNVRLLKYASIFFMQELISKS